MSQDAKPITYHREPKPRQRNAPVFVELTTECELEIDRLEGFLFDKIIKLASPELLELIYTHGDVMSLSDYNADRTLTLGQWKEITQHARELIGEA